MISQPTQQPAWERVVASTEGFDVLFDQEVSRLVSTLYAMSGSLPLAEDVAQDAFAHAWSRWSRVRESPSPAGWVYTTAFRIMRRRLILHRRPPITIAARPVDPTTSSEDRADLLEALRTLSKAQQRAVVLRFYVGMSTADVAERLNTSEGAVRSTVHRGMLRLRAALGSDPTEPL